MAVSDPGLNAERHAVELAANSIHWLLTEGDLAHAHPGLRCHAVACATQLIACQALLQETP